MLTSEEVVGMRWAYPHIIRKAEVLKAMLGQGPSPDF
jgi:hypothetical protein